VAAADVIQFDETLSPALIEAIGEALSPNPETELYVYGHSGSEIDPDLAFLEPCKHAAALSLNLTRTGLYLSSQAARTTAPN
jgi:hypothetical protein